MSIHFLSWNVRGLNNPQKRGVVKILLQDWKCDVVCLQETKLGGIDLGVIRSLCGNPYIDWVALNAVNTVGGVLLMWDKRVLEKVDSVVGTFSVSCSWKSLSNGFEWACSGIYGPNLEGLRAELWGELVDIRQRWNVSWCALGILMLPVSLVNDWSVLALVLLCWNFWIGLISSI
jgi:hypothetical protein